MGYLAKQREHVLGILENLPEEAMRRPVLPTGWTCAGLVQHLALDVERFWFRQVMAGEQVEPDEFGDDGWQVRPEASAAAVLDLYRREIELADKIITATSLEAPPAWWPDFFPPSFHLDNLRQVLLHVIASTARPGSSSPDTTGRPGLPDGSPASTKLDFNPFCNPYH
jgi:uncharacterized damage-inducible protein DinB